MSQIEKTPESKQKEIRIKELKKTIKRKRSTIKGLRTRLLNLQSSIEEMVKTSGNMVRSILERMKAIQEELSGLLKQLLKNKRIIRKREDRKRVKEMLNTIEHPLEEEEENSFRGFEGEMGGDYSEFEEEQEQARSRDIFAEFRSEPDKEEQRDIRKVYIRLSQAFHPDMASNEQEQILFHKRMQQIVEAYKRHDIDTLLRMERQYLEDEMEELRDDNHISLLDAMIERLERELSFLSNQSLRLSEEIKAIRASEMGQALTEYDRENRYGYGVKQHEQELEMAFKELERTKKVIETALEKNKMTPELAQELQPAPIPEDLLTDLLGFLGGDEFEEESTTKPRFNIIDFVVYTPPKNTPPIAGLYPGAIGRIEDMSSEGIKPVYYLSFEKKVIANLSDKIFDSFLDQYYEFALVRCREEDLKAYKGKPLNTLWKAEGLGRKRMYERLFEHRLKLPTAQKKRLLDILLAIPHATDEVNWVHFFTTYKLPYGIQARTIVSPYSYVKAGTKVEILPSFIFDSDVGILFGCKIKRKGGAQMCPIEYLLIETDGDFATRVEDYKLWAKYRLPESSLSPF